MNDALPVLLTKDQMSLYRRVGLPDHPLIKRAFQLYLTAQTLREPIAKSAPDSAPTIQEILQDRDYSEDTIAMFVDMAEEAADVYKSLGPAFIEENYTLIRALYPDASPEMIACFVLDPRDVFVHEDHEAAAAKLATIKTAFENLSPYMRDLCHEASLCANPHLRFPGKNAESDAIGVLKNIVEARETLDAFNFDFYTCQDGADMNLLAEVQELLTPCMTFERMTEAMEGKINELSQQAKAVARLANIRADWLIVSGEQLRMRPGQQEPSLPDNGYMLDSPEAIEERPVWTLSHLWSVPRP